MTSGKSVLIDISVEFRHATELTSIEKVIVVFIAALFLAALLVPQ